jgi:anhydro-N-acetylmuramic acid kinase
VAVQVSRVLDQDPSHTVLVTGGGAFNSFLIERIRTLTTNPLIIPDDLIVQYKEALIFAFLGVLRIRIEINCLCSVTGAREDSCVGAVYLP